MSRALAAVSSPFAVAVGFAFAAFSIAGCLQDLSTGQGTDTTATSTSGTTTPATSTAMQTGAGCSTDAQSQTTLCAQSSVCPGVAVDPGSLAGCGFRLQPGSVIDLECLCGDSLCPVGVPSTCAQATQLLSTQTALTVCEAASEGNGCVQVTGGSSSGSTTGAATTTTNSSSCDKTCESECAGEPDCIQLCGC